MAIFIITFFVLLIVITIMSVGVIMGRSPIKGSCGGVGAALAETDYICDLCGNDPNKCEEQQNQNDKSDGKGSALSYDASKPQ